MLIKLAEIPEIFSCFHDADIESGVMINENLIMTVEFQLKDNRKFSSNYSFSIKFIECQNIEFKTWPRIFEEKRRIMTDVKEIFSVPHWILEGNIINEYLQIVCSQSNNELDFCGGELTFKTTGAIAYEKSGKELTLDELAESCSICWNALKIE